MSDFEKWFLSNGIPLDTDFNVAKRAFEAAWQARVPEGHVVVPVEPSDYMRCTVRDFAPDIEDYENMSKWDWEKLCAEIYKAMLEAVEK